MSKMTTNLLGRRVEVRSDMVFKTHDWYGMTGELAAVFIEEGCPRGMVVRDNGEIVPGVSLDLLKVVPALPMGETTGYVVEGQSEYRGLVSSTGTTVLIFHEGRLIGKLIDGLDSASAVECGEEVGRMLDKVRPGASR